MLEKHIPLRVCYSRISEIIIKLTEIDDRLDCIDRIRTPPPTHSPIPVQHKLLHKVLLLELVDQIELCAEDLGSHPRDSDVIPPLS